MTDKFILLSNEQASLVRGVYEIDSAHMIMAELNPIPLKSGDYALPVDVVNDSCFQVVFELLSTLPINELSEEDFL